MYTLIYLVAPLLALLAAALATLAMETMGQEPWIAHLLWSLCGGLLVIWIGGGSAGMLRFFRRTLSLRPLVSLISAGLTLMVLVGAAILTTRPSFDKHFDVSARQVHTLSQQTGRIIEELMSRGNALKGTAFFSQEEPRQAFRRLLDLYRARGLRISIEWLDPREAPVRARSFDISIANTVVLSSDDMETRLTRFHEESLTNALRRLLRLEKKKVWFLTGHGEGDPEEEGAAGFSGWRGLMQQHHYEVGTWSLSQGHLPEEGRLIVLAGPRFDLKPGEVGLLQKWLQRGGALLVLVDALRPVKQINRLLEPTGMSLRKDIILLDPADPRLRLIGQMNAIIDNFDEFHPISQGMAAVEVVVPMARSVRTGSVDDGLVANVTGFARTAPGLIAVAGVESRRDLREIDPDRFRQGPFVVLAAGTGFVRGDALAGPGAGQPGRELRVVVGGSARLATNSGMARPENRDLMMNLVHFLSRDDQFIAIGPKPAGHSTLALGSPVSVAALYFICFIYPLLFLGGGWILWLRRRSV